MILIIYQAIRFLLTRPLLIALRFGNDEVVFIWVLWYP